MAALGVEGTTRGSHKPVTVLCDWQASPDCKRLWTKEWKTVVRDREAGDGSDICMACSRLLKSSGENNPNCRYPDLDEGFLETIDSEAKAYLLGWIASDGTLREGSMVIEIHDRDASILHSLRDMVSRTLPIFHREERAILRISRQRFVADACRHLGLVPGPKSQTVQFPSLVDDSLRWAFLRGLFDGDGGIAIASPTPSCSIASSSAAMREAIAAFVGIPCRVYEDSVRFQGVNAIDFMGKLYEGASLSLSRKREDFTETLLWQPKLKGKGNTGFDRPTLYWCRTHPDAVPPQKTRASDSGYDVTIIGNREEDEGRAVRLYRTGIRVTPPHGFYFDLVPRSSISKTGYMMANSFGVIDRAYRGEILVPLVKVVPDAPDLTFPIRIAQLILRQAVDVDVEEVDDLDDSARGTGGFGSTGIS